ncbi:potassium transporter Kup [Pontibacter chitinilyticus]|uniref:potassium transporter Kup n=1 Tax=Pontibacter chitinilyticus TaxID=2674989 RepID=UPI00321A2477
MICFVDSPAYAGATPSDSKAKHCGRRGSYILEANQLKHLFDPDYTFTVNKTILVIEYTLMEQHDPSNMTEQLPHKRSTKYLLLLSLSALGVVYGDIGTSPLYAIRECFYGEYGVPPIHDNILGVLSLVFWSLILVISFKYLIVVMRADNEGEGGILALMELVLPSSKKWYYSMVLVMGLFGAALLYGDGMITPAISVLSAVEGLNVATPLFEPYVIPITIAILLGLFLLQSKGTGGVGKIFGPIVLFWFLVLAALGISAIIKDPVVLKALNPYYAAIFFEQHGFHGLLVLGAVFLVVTGGEALYADMGHFGRFPIRLAWFCVVLPCLLCNYFGQGALLLDHPELAVNPFFHLAPAWALYPLVILSAFATVIASQAVISGAFSLTYQALNLGYFPRVSVLHTSERERGQIYIPQINWIIFAATVSLVVGFGSSSNLAAAYGVAVTTTMVITSVLGFIAMRKLWKWPLPFAIGLTIFFLIIDFSFFGANILKVAEGGWFPLMIATIIFLMMRTWMAGRRVLRSTLRTLTPPLTSFIKGLEQHPPHVVEGTAVYMTGNPKVTPPALALNLHHNKILHTQVVIYSLKVEKVPHVAAGAKYRVEEIAPGFFKVVECYGYMDKVDMQQSVKALQQMKTPLQLIDTTYFIGRETLIPSKDVGLHKWQSKLFTILTMSSQRATKYFNIPSRRVFEVGTQIKI